MFNKFILLFLCVAYVSAAANVTTYTYKTVGDLKIQLDVYTPPISPPKEGFPVFFDIHGGGDIAGSKKGAFTALEYNEVMKRGWVLVAIDYRLLPGVVLEDVFEDVRDAYQWVRTELCKVTPVNTDLITVFGRSAGGGLAVMSGFLLSPRPQAVIGFYSFCTNWTDPYSYKPGTAVDPVIVAAANKLSVPVVTEYTSTGKTDAKMALWNAALKTGKMGWLMTTHDPNLSTEVILAKLKTFSATENADKNYPPTYLAHGLVDTLVPYAQSVQLANKLKELNVPNVIDLVPGANHSFDNDSTFWQQHVLPAFDFVQKYMQTSSSSFKKVSIKLLER